MRFELTCNDLLVSLAKHYNTRGTHYVVSSRNLFSFLLRSGTRTYEWDTQRDSNSLVKLCYSSWLTLTPPEVPIMWFQVGIYFAFWLDRAQCRMNGTRKETWIHSWIFASLALVTITSLKVPKQKWILQKFIQLFCFDVASWIGYAMRLELTHEGLLV